MRLHWNVYKSDGEYLGAFKYAADAAVLVSCHGEGTQIRFGKAKRDTVFVEGSERVSANESYDEVARVCWEKLEIEGKGQGIL